MQDTELYRYLLGIELPWTVKKVQLDLVNRRVEVWADHAEDLRWPCPECGILVPLYDHAGERTWRHLDSCQFMTFLHARPPRVNCPEHGVHQVRLPWADAKARFTLLFERLAIDVLRETDVLGASRILRISWDEAWHILERAVERGLMAKEKRICSQIGVDEKSVGKGHTYMTLVCDLETSTVEFITEDRKQTSLDRYFEGLSDEQREGVEAIALDIWDPYIASVKAHIPQAEDKIVFDRYHLMMGGGGSGLAAAVSAAEHGLEVLVLEKLPVLGGTTGIAVGSLTANRTSLQDRAMIEDGLEQHVEDVRKFARPEIEARNNEPLRRYFLSESAATYEWLVGMGLAFHGPSPEPPNRVPRMHNVVPNAKAYIAVLQNRFLRLGGTITCNSPVKRIHIWEDGAQGVEAQVAGETIRFRARRGIVLAAGDYANSQSLIAAHKGDAYADIEGINPHAQGDGHRLIESIGGELINMDVTWGPEIRFVPAEKQPFVQLLPTGGWAAKLLGRVLPFVPPRIVHLIIKRLLVTWQHPDEAIFEDGAIMVNSQGERFCHEGRWPDREIALARQPGKDRLYTSG